MSVTVVGGGFLGLSLAVHAAERGCRVTLFEQYRVGHDRGSSHGDSRIFRTAYWEGDEYVEMAIASRRHWFRLNRIAGAEIYRECGGTYIGAPDGKLLAGVRCSVDRGSLEHIRPDLSAIVPRASSGAVIQEPHAGVINADRALAALRIYGERIGVRVLENSVWPGGDDAWGDAESPDAVIEATGPWLTASEAVGRYLRCFRVYCHWFRPTHVIPLYRSVFLIEGQDGRILYGMPTAGGRIKVGWHNYPLIPADPGYAERSAPGEVVRDIQAALETFTGVVLHHVESKGCYFTNTSDEDYLVTRSHCGGVERWQVGGLSGHGFKFAPAMAELIIDSLLARRLHPILTRFGTSRFGELGDGGTGRTHLAADPHLGRSWAV